MADDESFDLSGAFDESDFADSAPLDVETGLNGDSSSISGIDSVEASDNQTDIASDDADEMDEALVAPKRRSALADFSIFDGMLVCSLILVTLATLMMISELGNYGGFLSLPWKTSGISVN